jgi:precorrin-2 methylase
MIHFQTVVVPEIVPFKRRFNFKKANWKAYTKELDENITSIDPTPENYTTFIKLLRTISKKHIPRGCRTAHIPGLTSEIKKDYENYINLFERDPFLEPTMIAGEKLALAIAETRRKAWIWT